jgi:hypothetical protein
MSRSRIVVAVVIAAGLAVGVGIAAGLGVFNGRVGAFNGLRAAEHARPGATALPTASLSAIGRWNAENAKAHAARPRFDEVEQLLPKTARVLGNLPNGTPVFVLADTSGQVCLAGGLAGGCGPPLSRSNPLIISGADSPSPGGAYYTGGVALDGVTSVSFKAWDQEVTVPVKRNLYIDETPHSTPTLVHCVTAHFADGSTYREPVRGQGCGNH